MILKIKKRTLKHAMLLILVFALGLLFFFYFHRDSYQVSQDSFSYGQQRGKVAYEMNLLSHNATFDVYAIHFLSKPFLTYETKIYGLLLLPANRTNIPGIVLLPGGGVKKESELYLGNKIVHLGYAVLIIDQRGIGETGGIYLNFQQDYQAFKQGNEPIQHLSVYDALRAFDVLRSMKDIDTNTIAIAGESMGGRYALIAAAQDKRFKGVLGISTSGFHIPKDDAPENPYLLSIDPDHYIHRISPRNTVMMHSLNDTTISYNDAQTTFSLAKEPKKFYTVEGCGHGYCDAMDASLEEALSFLFQ